MLYFSLNREPIIHPIVQNYIDTVDMDLITNHHSHPCKVLFPKIFEENVQKMRFLLDNEMIDYKIYFANKATKSDIFVQKSLEQGVGIDVSSKKELQDALDMWFWSQDIIANWPKDIVFLKLCLENNVMISVDSVTEWKKILNLNIPSSSKIMIRICPPSYLWKSRFWITREEILTHITLLQDLNSNYNIYGLNFHIDTIRLQDKVDMIKHIISIREDLHNIGVSIEQLWIWWWFGIKYTKSTLIDQYPKEYPQWERVYGLEILYELLDAQVDDGLSFQQYLIETMTILHIEPGKLLLDQCGICIHNVIDKKGNNLFIDGNMYSLWSIWQEMSHDPIQYRVDGQENSDSSSCFIYWNLCMEFDKIFSRACMLLNDISTFDQIIFINTAAYFSDFSDSQPIKHNERVEIIV
jgi:diaminopimelate decarboxylase